MRFMVDTPTTSLASCYEYVGLGMQLNHVYVAAAITCYPPKSHELYIMVRYRGGGGGGGGGVRIPPLQLHFSAWMMCVVLLFELI